MLSCLLSEAAGDLPCDVRIRPPADCAKRDKADERHRDSEPKAHRKASSRFEDDIVTTKATANSARDEAQ